MGGGGGSNYSGVNQLAQQNYQNYQGQRNDLQNVLYSGLAGAAGTDAQMLKMAMGGYGDFLNSVKGGLGGGGANLGAAIATLQGMSGPGNPWAGQLGADIRARENSVLPGFYDQIRSAQQRLQNIQGGYNPGFTAQMAKMSREQAQQGQKGVLNTEIELGKQSAAAQAAQAAFENQKAMAIAGMQAQQAMSGSANAQANARLMLSGLGGLTNLYQATPGSTGMYLQGLMGNLGAGQSGATGQLGQLMQYNPQSQPWWQTALGGIAGIASPFAGLFGGGRGGGQQNWNPGTSWGFGYGG